MANRERGELRLVTRQRTYTLRIEVGCCCELEDAMGRSLPDILEAVNREAAVAIRALLWAALQPYHGRDVLTMEAAGDIADLAGGLGRTVVALSALMALNEDDTPQDERPSERPSKTGKTARSRWRPVYIAARRAGVDADRFWRMSLLELWRELAVQREVYEYDRSQIRAVAWYTAMLTRAKELPSFKQWLATKDRRQTVDEMKNTIAMLREMYPNTRHLSKRQVEAAKRKREAAKA